MLGQKIRYATVLLAFVLPVLFCSKAQNPPTTSPSSEAASLKAFEGRWDLSIKSPQGELPSWINVSEEQGQPKVLMVGVSDHATPLAQVSFQNGELDFLSPKGEEGFSEDMQFKGKLEGDELTGTVSGPGGTSWSWTGSRAPSLQRSGEPKWGKPVRLFNGENLDGWTFKDPSRSSVWKVEHGVLVREGTGSDIITKDKFEDFKLHLQFKCGPMSNSGIYLRGRYEVQIETDSASEPPSHHTGGVYGFLAPQPELPREPGVWRTFDITLLGRTVTVVEDGKTIIQQQEIPGITGGALDSHEGEPGPIYLQGTEKGTVSFRDVVLTPAE
jgi:3-keto-disaccharide hydrolase